MAKKASTVVVKAGPAAVPAPKAAPSLEDRVSELESDLVRIARLLASGNMDGAKFMEIVTKHQGKA